MQECGEATWGNKQATDGILSFYRWMLETSKGGLDMRSLEMTVHEFGGRHRAAWACFRGARIESYRAPQPAPFTQRTP